LIGGLKKHCLLLILAIKRDVEKCNQLAMEAIFKLLLKNLQNKKKNKVKKSKRKNGNWLGLI